MTGRRAFESHHRWIKGSVIPLACAAGFCAAAFLPGTPLPLAIFCWVFFGGLPLLAAAANFATRNTAVFRADIQGITFARPPLHRHGTPRRIPWGNVEYVVLWNPSASSRLVTIGAAVTRGGKSDVFPAWMRRWRLVPGVPTIHVMTSWQGAGPEDRAGLAAAFARLAPDTPLLDLCIDPVPPMERFRKRLPWARPRHSN
ncbi:hypothetical protein ACIBSV_21680 [Embleya sp. NPDC050154]|uniref:hypothetical protein n=1 Tax=Embleya sp. NPDC050154 TaxID=3363988 RepID=UPI00379F4602